MRTIDDGSAPRTDAPSARTLSKRFRPIPISSVEPARSGWWARRREMDRTLFILIGLGFIWRIVRYAAGQPLWGDEAFLAVSILLRDFAGLLRPLEYYQIAPAGFLWGERAAFEAFGPSEWALRLIPFAAGLASLGLFTRFALKVVDRRSALFAIGIFAASYYSVRHATEVKPYATDLLFSLVTTALAWRTWLDRESPRNWLALSAWVVFGVWCSYPLVFVVAGVGLVLAAEVGRSLTRRSVVCFLAFGLTTSASWFASYLFVARGQSTSAPFYTSLETWQRAFPPFERCWSMAAWLLDVHTGNMLAYPHGGNQFGSIVTALLVAAGALRLLKSRPVLLAMLLSPLGANLVAAAWKRYPYGTSARTSLFMAPAFCLLAGVGLAWAIRQLRRARRRRVARLVAIGLGSMMVVATVVNLGWPYKNYEDLLNREAVGDLAGLARPGDRWVIYDGVAELPMTRRLMLEHWLQQMAEVRYNVLARSPVPMDWMPEEGRVGAEAAPGGRTWLIVHRSGCLSFDEPRLDRLKASLGRGSGPPEARVIRLTRGESIEAFAYEMPVRVEVRTNREGGGL